MNICLIGDGLTNLALAKCLTEKNINVSLYYSSTSRKLSNNRTIGISKENFDFFQKNIIKINKFSWPIKTIKIFSEKNNKLLSFGEKEKEMFFMVKNFELYKNLEKKLLQKKNFKKIKIKNQSFYQKIIKKNKFDLVINSEKKNLINNKIFFKRILKDYKGEAATTFIDHQKCKNNEAVQVFTNKGPLAFLPISKTKTSIVYSIHNYKNYTENQIKNLVLKYNQSYKIKNFSKFEKFKLKLSINRNYFYKNILCFGDNLHSIHPLAGQGFNMTIRDIKIFLKIIDHNINLGLPLDKSVLLEFELKTKHLNYIFSAGIDFIHEFFRIDIQKSYSKKILKTFDKNSLFKKYVTKFANSGFNIY